MAIIGEISIKPNLGMIRRKGMRTGSVILNRKLVTGLLEPMGSQDRTARAKMAMLNSWHNQYISVRKNVTLPYPPSVFDFS